MNEHQKHYLVILSKRFTPQQLMEIREIRDTMSFAEMVYEHYDLTRRVDAIRQAQILWVAGKEDE